MDIDGLLDGGGARDGGREGLLFEDRSDQGQVVDAGDIGRDEVIDVEAGIAVRDGRFAGPGVQRRVDAGRHLARNDGQVDRRRELRLRGGQLTEVAGARLQSGCIDAARIGRETHDWRGQRECRGRRGQREADRPRDGCDCKGRGLALHARVPGRSVHCVPWVAPVSELEM